VKTKKENEYRVVRARYGVRPYLEVNYRTRRRAEGMDVCKLGRCEKKVCLTKKKQGKTGRRTTVRKGLIQIYRTLRRKYTSHFLNVRR